MGARHAIMGIDVGEVGLARHDVSARAGGNGDGQDHHGGAAQSDKHERTPGPLAELAAIPLNPQN